MNKLFENIKKRIILTATEACAYRENIRVISEAELKKILEEEFAADTNVGGNGWIPVTERLPKNNDNVRVTVNRNGKHAVAIGWYNHDKEKWKVCLCHEDDFLYQYGNLVVAWKENTEEPYKPESTEKTAKRTNADRIRAMTDEELADTIIKNTLKDLGEIIPFCKNYKRCEDMLDSLDGISESMCRECLLEWLNKPEGDVSG